MPFLLLKWKNKNPQPLHMNTGAGTVQVDIKKNANTAQTLLAHAVPFGALLVLICLPI